MSSDKKKKLTVSLLDYGAGNVRSVRNAILANGYEIIDINSPEQIAEAECIIFPGVGSYGTAMKILNEKQYAEPLKAYLAQNRPYLGICLGMQTLFESSDETPGTSGLGVIPGHITKFDDAKMAVPHIGWNGRIAHQNSPLFRYVNASDCVYFVHSFYAPVETTPQDWILTTTQYEGQSFVSSVQKGNIAACQFHPEKSGQTGLNILKGFLENAESLEKSTSFLKNEEISQGQDTTQLVKRIVVALDVRSNDAGDLVVTKGDQYDVREADENNVKGRGGVRNLGKPVSLAARYYNEGADEIAFLNITSFRQGVLDDMPMLQVLEEASKNIFVPLTVGGGIRSYTCDSTGETYSALTVASRYFRAGADKVSIGSDAVYAAEAYYQNSNNTNNNISSIEEISTHYGAQAVVISIDPQRVYTNEPSHPVHKVVPLSKGKGPNGEPYCWYQCTVKGGREKRDICAVRVAVACEKLGAGEIMLNCIDMDGQCQGYDHELMKAVSEAVTIPVIASSGAGKPVHFTDVFRETGVQAALAAGMFHRKEVEIDEVKKHMLEAGVPARLS
mmetsp:Transcript_21685/g.33152  ORF Transcript_21685/g.33152 Transcript_21685/m.33152 type:complete len:560 (-) Transcript_21685:53-1732(-)|eukprot:CAMPEP_0196809314 /NCGR_PEP_ID=MMETSP1362-20130617/9263_1 /TAXON_ID=163516 /ORGANISM="Leptocylindrus danicus, Strain CCMP1856" /LENGTH=559 /DNA_ID=CAMNT_0042183971 /DNA_START=15 /DNA_END=1694 /DNA_ORIENTATION=+